MKVKDVMTTSVATVRRSDSLSAAAQRMWDCDCGSVPVKDETSERVVGMITDRDICMATWSQDKAPGSIRISEVMSSELHAVAPDDSIATAEDLMRSKQIRRMPVLNVDGTLAGILSLADIATASQHIGARVLESDLRPAAVAVTLAKITRPRGISPSSSASSNP